MRATLELPDPLFTCLTARAASERITFNQLLRHSVEQGLNATPPERCLQRSAVALPRLERPISMPSDQLSNAASFDLLEPCAPRRICPI